MKRSIIVLTLLTAVLTLNARTKIVFAPQWTPQAQFAGFYMALEKGFYSEVGLDVQIVHQGMNSSENSLDRLLRGDVQIAGNQLLAGLIRSADGSPLVNVMTITQKSGLCCVTREPISSPSDFNGKKVGKWKSGFSEFCEMMEVSNGIQVDWVPSINGINLFIFGAVDAMLCETYNELIALRLAVGNVPDERIIKFYEYGYDCPEDVLFVTEEYYLTHTDEVKRFAEASRRGWNYVRENPEEALAVTQKYIDAGNIVTNNTHQKYMLEEYLSLQVNPRTGISDFAPVSEAVFNKVCDALIATGFVTRSVEYKDFVKCGQ